MKNLLPLIKRRSIVLLAGTVLLGQSYMGFSQCTTTVFSENFNVAGNTNNNLNNTTLPAGETKGTYNTVGGGSISVTNNADCCGGATNNWKSNSSRNPGWGPTGNDGGDITDFALMVYGGSTVANGTVWCTNITVAAGDIYDFSAFYTSPWLESGIRNNPGLWLSINGVQISPTAIVVSSTSTTSTTSYTPYLQQACTYTIPSGTSGSVPFCIGMAQTCNNTTWGTCATGSGNDFLVDDILIKKCTGGTAIACTYQGTTTPVTLISFTAIKTSASTATLQWETATEKNTSYFSVEKSFDGIHFSEIGMVKAYGNSSSLITYKFNMDFNATAYYRLKIMDFDGSYTYSNIQALEQKDNISSVRIADGRLEISASVSEGREWIVSVYSMLGQELFHEKLNLKAGLNSFTRDLPAVETNTARIVKIIDSHDGSQVLSRVIMWQ
jgi:hypothetical protein